jgi:hypothetical protein
LPCGAVRTVVLRVAAEALSFPPWTTFILDVDVAVSLRAMLICGNEACKAGFDFPATVTVNESVPRSASAETEIVPAVVESEAAPDKPAVPLVAVTVT